jgi:pimeloyl-ACP methyl ester carboxylesterase
MNKSTLVLIPGLLCDKHVWQHQVATLAPYVDIIIPDITKLQSAEAVINFILTEAPLTFYLAGHSMGGWLALELMRKHSKRVKKLCIMATSASLDSADKTRLRKQCLQLMSTLSKDEMTDYLAQLYVYNPHIQPQLKDMFKRNFDAFVPQQQAMMQRASCEDILPVIKTPTTVIVGEEDSEFFSSSKFIAEHIYASTFITIRECGHMLTLEQPERCAKLLLAWLTMPLSQKY